MSKDKPIFPVRYIFRPSHSQSVRPAAAIASSSHAHTGSRKADRASEFFIGADFRTSLVQQDQLENKKRVPVDLKPAFCCGDGEIRTRDTVSRIHTFQACSFNHSDTSPFLIPALPDRSPLVSDRAAKIGKLFYQHGKSFEAVSVVMRPSSSMLRFRSSAIFSAMNGIYPLSLRFPR
jgi:hypothetical protein